MSKFFMTISKITWQNSGPIAGFLRYAIKIYIDFRHFLFWKFVDDCGHGCDWVYPYGFVPECDCPVHDPPYQDKFDVSSISTNTISGTIKDFEDVEDFEYDIIKVIKDLGCHISISVVKECKGVNSDE